MYSENELKVLNKLSEDIYGCKFEDLKFEDQDMLYCYAEDNDLM